MPLTPARPSDELLARLFEGKRALHAAQRALPLPEKFQIMLELQKIAYAIRLDRGDPMEWWERPWDVEP
jgi:hypothetical protein